MPYDRMSISMSHSAHAAISKPLNDGSVKSRKKRVGEQMGEQKPHNAKRPHKMGPLGVNMAER